ncbi:hypothetical protein [Hydrogenovibrio thermophilus]|uniref:Uncharacterized protein n=1 Tax=Hydrogenovibrio thermophilus TaxID=265883 RepID=A0A451G531_9GAMM|nr:hypothetical protein [Hydrogenovibrio thermophilus]QAB14603.1 hypothetical protein EPV75_02440 [Hydrogenovibrio thermophilus]
MKILLSVLTTFTFFLSGCSTPPIMKPENNGQRVAGIIVESTNFDKIKYSKINLVFKSDATDEMQKILGWSDIQKQIKETLISKNIKLISSGTPVTVTLVDYIREPYVKYKNGSVASGEVAGLGMALGAGALASLAAESAVNQTSDAPKIKEILYRPIIKFSVASNNYYSETTLTGVGPLYRPEMYSPDYTEQAITEYFAQE